MKQNFKITQIWKFLEAFAFSSNPTILILQL